MLASRARHVAPPLLRALAAQAPFGGSAVRLGSAGAAGGAAEAPPRPPAAPPPPAAVPPAGGASYSVTKTFSAADVAAFTALSGDANPIHTDPAAAAAAQLPGCILPGLLSASLFPGIIGSAFPGAVYVTQTLRFKRYALVRSSQKAGIEGVAVVVVMSVCGWVCARALACGVGVWGAGGYVGRQAAGTQPVGHPVSAGPPVAGEGSRQRQQHLLSMPTGTHLVCTSSAHFLVSVACLSCPAGGGYTDRDCGGGKGQRAARELPNPLSPGMWAGRR